uniref:RNase H domain-containing protein n=1 Tax=Steinernema glaseri TaxID=37863 RepID=A0A1I7YTH3_9BILA
MLPTALSVDPSIIRRFFCCCSAFKDRANAQTWDRPNAINGPHFNSHTIHQTHDGRLDGEGFDGTYCSMIADVDSKVTRAFFGSASAQTSPDDLSETVIMFKQVLQRIPKHLASSNVRAFSVAANALEPLISIPSQEILQKATPILKPRCMTDSRLVLL